MNLFHHYNLKKGIGFMLLAFFCVSSIYAVSKLIATHTTVPTMLFFRNIFGLIVVAPWIIAHWPKSAKIKNVKVIIIRSLTGLLNLFFIFLAVQKISLVNATLLNNTAPFFVPLIVWLWLKTPVNHKLWPAIILGFIGIGIILHPDKSIFNLGAVYGLLSGIVLAFTLVTMRLASKQENLYTILLYFFLIGLVATTPFAIIYWKIDNYLTLLGLISLGVLSTALQVLLFFGLKSAKAHQLAPFTYSAVVFSGIYEWLIWKNTPDLLAYAGIVLIVAAGIWVVIVSTPHKELK